MKTKSSFFCVISTILFIVVYSCSSLQADQVKLPQKGFGLLAHWSFDEDYSSSVNNELYKGDPIGEPSVQIIQDSRLVKVGKGALKLDSSSGSEKKSFVSIRNPLFGYYNAEVFTVVAWYRYEDLSGDGSDDRNFVWESTPGYSLAFGLQRDKGKRDAEWWFETASHSSVSDRSGPIIKLSLIHI